MTRVENCGPISLSTFKKRTHGLKKWLFQSNDANNILQKFFSNSIFLIENKSSKSLFERIKVLQYF